MIGDEGRLSGNWRLWPSKRRGCGRLLACGRGHACDFQQLHDSNTRVESALQRVHPVPFYPFKHHSTFWLSHMCACAVSNRQLDALCNNSALWTLCIHCNSAICPLYHNAHTTPPYPCSVISSRPFQHKPSI